jgi:hypothetical protein
MPLERAAGLGEGLADPLLEGERGLQRHLAVHLGEHPAREREVAGLAQQVHAREVEDGVEVDGPAALQQRHEALEVVLRLALVDREQHLLLAREVEVDRALGEAGGVGHLRDARHAVGPLDELGLGRVEDRAAARFLVLVADGPLLDRHVNK